MLTILLPESAYWKREQLYLCVLCRYLGKAKRRALVRRYPQRMSLPLISIDDYNI
jgi:hypothetical protein